MSFKTKIIAMKKILIIDDEPDMNPRIIAKLKTRYKVEIAGCVRAAQNYLQMEKEFDLIILDIMMPPRPYSIEETKSGMETGWVLYDKTSLRSINVPIIIWTRNKHIFSKPWGKNVKDIIIKTYDDDQLLHYASKYLD